MKKKKFSEIKVGDYYTYNGLDFVKVNECTGRTPKGFSFYMTQSEYILIKKEDNNELA